MTDYHVNVTIKFRMDFNGTGEMNILAFPNVVKAFGEHISSVFHNNNDIESYITGDLNFDLNCPFATLKYVFSCYDENEEEAESFAEYVLDKTVKSELESFGCKIIKMNFEAEEADMSWYDKFEDAIFGVV